MQQNGELIKIQEKMLVDVKKHADRPERVEKITRTTKYKRWFFDPSVVVQRNIKDEQGRVIVSAGTMVNPLSFVPLTKALLFYDADDKAQVRWAHKMNELFGKNKLILVNGSVSLQMKEFKKEVYFDQHGRITTKLNIQHVPVMVTQEGLRMKIEEMVP